MYREEDFEVDLSTVMSQKEAKHKKKSGGFQSMSKLSSFSYCHL